MGFTEARKEVGYVKGSLYGPPGSGKTTLLAMLLIYLSKTYHKSAPVAWLASEKGVDFVIDFFKIEGVPLLVNRSRSFVDLKSAHGEALREGCCGLGVDSTTHFWQELLSSGMKGKGPRLGRIQRVKEEWAPFAADFQDASIHSLATGRLGFKWEDYEVENEKGEIEKEVMRAGTKMKAEGDFGHEPDLEIEMSAVEDPDFIKYEKVRGRARRTFKSQMLHVATLKKSRVWALNGKAFSWKDQVAYKPGYYRTVAEAFKPHFDMIAIGGTHHVGGNGGDSRVLFENGSDQSYHEGQIKRQIAMEKFAALLSLAYGGQTEVAKRARSIIGHEITGTFSQTEMQERLTQVELENAANIMARMKERIDLEGFPSGKSDQELEANLRRLANIAKDDVLGNSQPTLNEILMRDSVEAANIAKRNRLGKPQAVARVLDEQPAELAGD